MTRKLFTSTRLLKVCSQLAEKAENSYKLRHNHTSNNITNT